MTRMYMFQHQESDSRVMKHWGYLNGIKDAKILKSFLRVLVRFEMTGSPNRRAGVTRLMTAIDLHRPR